MTMPDSKNETLVRQDYKYGFVTAIDADTVPPGLPADAQIVIYSNRVIRSLERASHLRAYGKTNAKSLDRDLEAWHGPEEDQVI